MQIDYEKINDLIKLYGDAFYLLDSEQFEKNYRELKSAFTDIYPEFNIAYSYKTNYTPKFCKIVDSMGGYAEVVSDMEAEIALRIGVSPKNIIWNGPYKNLEKVKELLLLGATVNIDSIYEVEPILSLADRFPEKILNVGVRCNFVVNDGVVSRFGFDVESEEFECVLKSLQGKKNINIEGLQCHFATRDLKTWKPRAVGMIDLIDKYGLTPAHIDLGGGLFGKMDDSLKKQFSSYIPAYTEYAEEVATVFANRFTGEYRPQLLIEPGSALVGDCMKFAAKVVNIKNVRGKNIATVLGSIYNINPTLNKKNPPLKVLSDSTSRTEYEDLDFGGFTCIESDYLYRGYTGALAAGDIVVFSNVGSYSVVLKPPFILPNFPVLDICGESVSVEKRKECFDDIFHTFKF